MNQVNYYLVGGAVRDRLLGIESKDLDYAVEAESYDAMRESIISRGGSIFLETPQHFTIRAKVPGLGASDFVLCRKDGAYSDGRRPDSVAQGTLADDLARRDFTVNAIAQAEDGTIIDPFNGRRDLEEGILRCVGNINRLKEDSLRMLRAIRFSITKNLALDEEIEKFLGRPSSADLLSNVSIERIREELKKCFDKSPYWTMNALVNLFPYIGRHIFSRNITLIPTIIGK